MEENYKKKIEIISINYNTPDLIDILIKSVRDIEGDYKIRIIDGSDREPFQTEIKKVCEEYNDVLLQQQGWNIHHGRGMNLAISNSNYEWVLIIDSDNYIKQPIITKMINQANIKNKKIIGWHCYVNKGGFTNGMNYSDKFYIKYYHPSFLLINVDYYKKIKNDGIAFVHHGAPSIKIMEYLHDNKLTDIVCDDFTENTSSEISKIINLKGRGTVNRFGYNID